MGESINQRYQMEHFCNLSFLIKLLILDRKLLTNYSIRNYGTAHFRSMAYGYRIGITLQMP